MQTKLHLKVHTLGQAPQALCPEVTFIGPAVLLSSVQSQSWCEGPSKTLTLLLSLSLDPVGQGGWAGCCVSACHPCAR